MFLRLYVNAPPESPYGGRQVVLRFAEPRADRCGKGTR